ncbi:MAG: PAS domain S-box protein [Methanomicrobiales archaeon]|nr:PAS domain S-box protein [Methanomicrobiales archaeon]
MDSDYTCENADPRIPYENKTDDKKTNYTSEDNSFLLDTLFDILPVHVMVTDERNHFRRISRFMQDEFALSLTDSDESDLFQKLQISVPGSNASIPSTDLPLTKSVSTGQVIKNFEIQIKSNETVKIFSISAAPVKNYGNEITGAIGIWQDITKIRELQQKEQLLNAIMKFTPFGIMLVDNDAKITNVSRYFENVVGIPEKNLIGIVERTDEWGVLNPSTHKPVNFQSMPLYRVIHEQKVIVDEEYILSINGIHKYFAITAGPILDETGQPVGGISVWRDITNSHKLLRENERQKNLLELIISEIPVGIAIHDGPDFVLSLINPAYMTFAGRSDIKGKKVRDVFPEAAPKIISLLKHVYETGEPIHIVDEEFTLMRNSIPKKSWFTFSYLPFYGEEDTITGVLTWVIETTSYVTQKMEIESSRDMLRSEREILQTILDTIPVMIILFDPKLKKIKVNKAFERITGWSEQDFNMQSATELFNPEINDNNGRSDSPLSHHKGFRDIQMKMKNGNTFDASWANVYLPDGRGIGVGIDITERKKFENELSIAAQRFNRITSSNIVGAIITDFDGSLSYANDYFLNTIGYSRENFENGKVNLRKITPPEYIPKDNQARLELSQYGTVNPYEKEFIKKDGTRVWVLLADIHLPGPQNEVFSFVLNIDDRVHAFKESQTRRAEIEAILNSIPDGYIVYNKDGSIAKMNQLANDVLGITDTMERLPYLQRLRNLNSFKPDGSIFPPQEQPSWRALQGEFVKDIVMKLLKNEDEKWISVSASPIIINNSISGAIVEFTDITKLHKLQMQLSDERNFVNAILDTSGALILAIGEQGQIIRFNKECERITGYSQKDFSEINILKLIPEDEIKNVEDVLFRLLKGEPLLEFENHWITKDNRKRYIRWRNSSYKDEEGKIKFVVATGIDISDRKELEEELKNRAHALADANTSLQSFAYSVSHDLRSPLSIVDGFTDLLIDDYSKFLDSEGREYLHRIKDSVKKMQNLISDILNLSSISRQELKRDMVDLSEIISEYLSELHKQQPNRSVEFKIQKNVVVNADSRLLYVALENLLRNAWKFTSKNTVTKIEFGTVNIHNKKAFYIRDNGVGFNMKFAKTIFEPFKRVHSEKDFGGTGVGLSIVQRVITRHGGEIWAESEVGIGTTFYFTLSEL